MKHFSILYIVIIFFWFIASGNVCGNHPGNDCTEFKTDTLLLPFDVTNQATVFHIADSIHLFSKISDNIHPPSGTDFIFKNDLMTGIIQGYKVVPSGTSFELNYSNNDFDRQINFGNYQSAGNLNYITYERSDPFNTLGLSLIPRDTGLYVFVVSTSNGYPETNCEFFRGNDHCKTYAGFASVAITKQNQEYWDSIGITSIALSGVNNYVVKKSDRNYFFVKVLP